MSCTLALDRNHSHPHLHMSKSQGSVTSKARRPLFCVGSIMMSTVDRSLRLSEFTFDTRGHGDLIFGAGPGPLDLMKDSDDRFGRMTMLLFTNPGRQLEAPRRVRPAAPPRLADDSEPAGGLRRELRPSCLCAHWQPGGAACRAAAG
jgi:hypothetical protein